MEGTNVDCVRMRVNWSQYHMTNHNQMVVRLGYNMIVDNNNGVKNEVEQEEKEEEDD